MNTSDRNQSRATTTMQALNRLLTAFQYSLASYLYYARPWTHAKNARLFEVVRQISSDHRDHVVRTGRLILKRRGTIARGQFPLGFTAYNDLALDYLAQRLVEHERELIDQIGQCVAAVVNDPEARQLVESILARETQRFQTLTKLVSLSPMRRPSSLSGNLAA